MTPVKYVGKKPKKTDTATAFNTGTVWNGHGDVQLVEDVIARQMADKYPEIWSLDVEAAAPVEVPDEDTDPGDPDADPDENLADVQKMHWQKLLKYINECEIEELQDILELERKRPTPRARVIDELSKRLN